MKVIKALFSRMTLIVIAALLELLLLATVLRFVESYAGWIEAVLRLLSLFIAVNIITNSEHLSFDVMWLLLVVLFPVAGTAFYLLLGTNLLTSKTTRALVKTDSAVSGLYEQDQEVYDSACRDMPRQAPMYYYLSHTSGFPVYRNREYDYYPLGQDGFPVMLEELKQAKEFIFVEYFIIEEGKMWDAIHEILRQKASQGLDVRVLYDDVGSFSTLSAHYASKLEKEGIKAIPFNRINPFLSTIMNHRDHRKIMVIDGVTAFSGGVNLADEYINEKKRFDIWKDNMIRVKGEAVWSFTLMFLSHWNALRPTDQDMRVFFRQNTIGKSDGYVVPYGETPLDAQVTAQDVYIGMLENARKYCWIMTPYLIIDNDMNNALIRAARRGVDVRILLPGIPDKKTIWNISKSFAQRLIQGGVKVYLYHPGFVHAKVFVSDDVCAAVGTINLDYRSLYLHFENGTYLTGAKEVLKIKEDCADSFAHGELLDARQAAGNPFKAFVISFLRIFAAQM